MRVGTAGGVFACSAVQVRALPFSLSLSKSPRIRTTPAQRRVSIARKTDSENKVEVPSFIFERSSGAPSKTSSSVQLGTFALLYIETVSVFRVWNAHQD